MTLPPRGSPRRKKIILCAAILLLSATGFLLNTKIVQAQGVAGGFKGAALTVLGKTVDVAASLGVIYVVFWAIFGVLMTGFGYVSSTLNYFFHLNRIVNPAQLSVVQAGWTTLRDVANGIFILIILWVAFTIIFNLENLGGKRLLIRIILVALLINFSLVMVSAVFGFANVLAEPFPEAMGLVRNPVTPQEQEAAKSGISGLIVGNSRIQTLAQLIKDEGTAEAFKKLAETQKNQTPNPPSGDSMIHSLLKYVGAPDPIPAAQAGVGDAAGVAACLIGLVGGIPGAGYSALCLAAQGAIYVGITLASWWAASGLIGPAINGIFNLVIADGLLALTMISLLAAIILLVMRLIAMVFLGVFAPIAFLSLAIPRYGDRLWNTWIDNLFRWAFVTPIFYFLLYLSLLVLSRGSVSFSPEVQAMPLQSNIFAMLNLIFFLIFLWAAIFLTRKSAGMGAEAALSLGKKAGGFLLGVTTGGVAGLAASAARRATPRLQKVLGSTVLRQTTLARRTGAYLERQKARVAPHEKELSEFSDDYLVQEYDRSIRAERKVAIANLLAKKGKFNKLEGRQQNALKLAGQFGPQSVENLLKARPDLANSDRVSATDVDKELGRMGLTRDQIKTADSDTRNKAARLAILRKIKTNEAADISDETFDNPERIKEMWQVFSSAHIAKIASDKPAMLAEMKKVLEDPSMDVEITPAMRQYLVTTTAQAVGLSLPAHIKRSEITVQGEIREQQQELRTKGQEIDRLSEEADLLRTRGETAEADKQVADAQRILRFDIPKIENNIQRLNQELTQIQNRRTTQQSTAGTVAGNTPPTQASTPTPAATTSTDPLGPRGSITGEKILKDFPSWVDDAWRNLQAGGGTPSQKTIFGTPNLSDAEKRRQLAEELARGYKAGRY